MSDFAGRAWETIRQSRFLVQDPEQLWAMVESAHARRADVEDQHRQGHHGHGDRHRRSADIPDLRGQVVAGKDFSKRAGDERTDYDGHGTTMAVLIAGTGARGATTGSYGLAPGTKITPIRIPGFIERNRTDGNQDDFPTAAAKAIRFAADSDAQIINISAGSTGNSQELTKAVAYALSKGKLIFAGVGNTGDALNELNYPAASPGAVGVGAIGRNVQATKESQHGPQVDLVAPGEDIISACLGGTKLCNSHGTSDATALASASAALIWSKYPDWTNNQVLRVMLNTASKAKSSKERTDHIGYGAVRPRIALTNPGDPGPADVYPLPDFKQAMSKTPEGSASAAAKEGSSQSPAASASTGDSAVTPWVLAGAGVVVLSGVLLIARAVRRRRAAATAGTDRPVPPGPGQTDWSYTDSNYGGRS